MNLQEYSFEFTYSDSELKKLRFYSKGFITILCCLFMILIMSLMFLTNNTTNHIFLMIYILFMVTSTILIIIGALKVKIDNNLKGIQNLHFENGDLIFENGSKISKIEIKCISKIKEAKYFYYFKIAYGVNASGKFILIYPTIPQRLISTKEMELLADSLHIDFKKR